MDEDLIVPPRRDDTTAPSMEQERVMLDCVANRVAAALGVGRE